MKWIKKHPIFLSVVIAEIIGILAGVPWGLYEFATEELKNVTTYTIGAVLSLFIGIVLVYPAVLTVINIIFLFFSDENTEAVKIESRFKVVTLVYLVIYELQAVVAFCANIGTDWNQALVTGERHTPIYTGSYPTVIAVAAIAILGYMILRFKDLKDMPPLLIVLSISFMYMGVAECILIICQMFNVEEFFSTGNIALCFAPINLIIIVIKVIKIKVYEWKMISEKKNWNYKNKVLTWGNKVLSNSNTWPVAAFLLMWPVLGIMICVMALFGQQPDSIIKAFTETSDWNLSTCISPPSVPPKDGHYLCTVAAGGHAGLVKPLRRGVRHGHDIIVNRQLCVANAFEQILEEKTPVLHKHVRHFYDTYGLPIAKLIKSPYAADFVYIIMKPLEWIFLIVLYLCDVNPENRIEVQYSNYKMAGSNER